MKTLAWVMFWPISFALSVISSAFGIYAGTGGHKPMEGNIDFTYILAVPIGVVGYFIGCLATAILIKDRREMRDRLGLMILGSQAVPFFGAFVIYLVMDLAE